MRTGTPVFANIAYLRFGRFDERPVAEQAGLKAKLEARLRVALAKLPAADRIVLDAADGVALVLFGEPARALEVAQSLAAAAGEEPLKMGLNHGPIAVTARDAGAMVFGDGITLAAAAAGFAPPGRLFATVPFAKMLEATRPDRAAELAPAGEFTDARVRLHSFYTPDPKRLVARRNRLSAYGLAGILIILLLGIAGRDARDRYFPPRPAVVEFEVTPRGDVIVDGLRHGRTPPLTHVELPPGRHVIQVRANGKPPLTMSVNLEPGERMKVTHSFAGERREDKPGDAIRNFFRRFGF